ncbi:RNA-dependent RNA polymerase [water chestnut virus A]|uniref:RNA-directed RNA polymerase 2a n=1 Tax=water chestnut virus A TaxID=2884706 RepID=A0A8K1K0B8_9BROM|nr:RNA-dependent RNA polymerase [water chestnut virus A]
MYSLASGVLLGCPSEEQTPMLTKYSKGDVAVQHLRTKEYHKNPLDVLTSLIGGIPNLSRLNSKCTSGKLGKVPSNVELSRESSATSKIVTDELVYQVIGWIMIQSTIVKLDKYHDTEFASIPWLFVRFSNLFDLEADDDAFQSSWIDGSVVSAKAERSVGNDLDDNHDLINCNFATDNLPYESAFPSEVNSDVVSSSNFTTRLNNNDDAAIKAKRSGFTGLSLSSDCECDERNVEPPQIRYASRKVLRENKSSRDVFNGGGRKDPVEVDKKSESSIPRQNNDGEDDDYTFKISGEILFKDEIPNSAEEISVRPSETLCSIYKGFPKGVDWWTLCEADVSNADGFDKLITRNDWTLGRKLCPNIPFPSDDDVILSGIKTTDPAVMQSAIDEIFPLHHEMDDDFYQEMVECNDIALELDRCSLDLSYIPSWEKGAFGLNSKLHTGLTSTRKTTFREVVLAVKKRNMNVPQLSTICDIDDISNKVVNKFFSSVVDVNKLVGLPDVICQGEVEWFSDYLKNKSVSPDEFIDPICLVSMDKYRHMIKSQLKPVEDNSLAYERPLAATITYHDKGKVMSTSPIFLAAAARLQLCLDDKITIPSGKHHQLFSLDAQSFKLVEHWKEIDFSKFDKSQQEIHHEIQRKIFIRLGVPMDFIETWFISHKKSHMSDSCGLKFSTDFQRRTGDACTYLGNTIVTLSVLCYVYDLTDPNVLMVVASGDDSLIGSINELNRENEHLCSTLFNFEAKFPHNQPFICSKFLITMPTYSGGEKVIAVPNPVKLLIKLGKKNLDPNQFDDWYTSWLDLIHYFNDPRLISEVAEMCAFRYLRGPSTFLEPAMYSFKNLFSSKTKVKRILFSNDITGEKKKIRPPKNLRGKGFQSINNTFGSNSRK